MIVMCCVFLWRTLLGPNMRCAGQIPARRQSGCCLLYTPAACGRGCLLPPLVIVDACSHRWWSWMLAPAVRGRGCLPPPLVVVDACSRL